MYIKWLPESARYHVVNGQTDKALATLEQVNRAVLLKSLPIKKIN